MSGVYNAEEALLEELYTRCPNCDALVGVEMLSFNNLKDLFGIVCAASCDVLACCGACGAGWQFPFGAQANLKLSHKE